MLKKTCYSCGAKVDKLYSGQCEKCLKEVHPPIKEVKQMKFNICNMSGEIEYKNTYYTQEEFEEKLPFIVKSHVTIEDHYDLKEIQIENFEIDGHQLIFDIVAVCDLK